MNALSGAPIFDRVRRQSKMSRANVSSGQENERFREVVLPHLAEAMALARWLTGNHHDAEDVVQDACLRALAGIDGYAGRGARAWLLTIVRNASFQWLAKNRPKGLVLAGDAAEVEDLAGSGDENERANQTPEAELLRQADTALVQAALETLPLPFREVLVMRDINELSY